MYYIGQFLIAFAGTIGFSVLFNIPKDSVVKSGLNGAFGWITYVIFNELLSSSVAGAFLGAIVVGLTGEVFARFFKKPATVFIIPGIIPLVPGSKSYYSMLAFIEKRYTDAADLASETIFIALSIASGIIIASSINKIFKKKKLPSGS